MHHELIYLVLQKDREIYCFCGTVTRERELEEVFREIAERILVRLVQ